MADGMIGADGFSISANAAKKIASLMASENKPGLMLRLAVNGGGCSGFQYDFSFDETRNSDDRSFQRDGVTVLVDEVSLEFLQGAELDYVEQMIGASFQVKNPNAASSCGCGSSFSI
ncbi:MAG: iron-sulfur cluster insertion protein ErpA [Pseudomonadota bacterium]